MSYKTSPTMQNSPHAAYDQPSSLNVDYSDAPEIYHPAPQQAQQLPQAQQAQAPSIPPPAKSSRICGLPRQTFWLVIILVIVVVAAAVGGGVGGALAVENARSKTVAAAQVTPPPASSVPSASASTTPTASASGSTTSARTSASPSAYIPTLPGSVSLVDSSCPTSDVTTITVRGIQNSYNCTTQLDYPGNDITALTAYTLQQCVEACVLYNINQGSKVCLGVAHSPHMSEYYNMWTGNCYLKKMFGDRKSEVNDWTTAMLRS